MITTPELKCLISPYDIKFVTIRSRKGCALRVPSLLTTKFGPSQNKLATNQTRRLQLANTFQLPLRGQGMANRAHIPAVLRIALSFLAN